MKMDVICPASTPTRAAANPQIPAVLRVESAMCEILRVGRKRLLFQVSILLSVRRRDLSAATSGAAVIPQRYISPPPALRRSMTVCTAGLTLTGACVARLVPVRCGPSSNEGMSHEGHILQACRGRSVSRMATPTTGRCGVAHRGRDSWALGGTPPTSTGPARPTTHDRIRSPRGMGATAAQTGIASPDAAFHDQAADGQGCDRQKSCQ